MFDEHLQQVVVVEVESLLLFHLLELLLVDPADVHEKEVGLVVDFDIELTVLFLSGLPDYEPEGQEFLNPDLFAFLVNLPDFDRYFFSVDNLHISLKQGVEVLDPCFIDRS